MQRSAYRQPASIVDVNQPKQLSSNTNDCNHPPAPIPYALRNGGQPVTLNQKSYRTLLLAIFAISGFAGLIYQSIWSHYFGLFLGHAAYSQALVLSLFMGGMALGAGAVSRYGSNWSNLIRAYAVAEALIGVFGIGFHWMFVNFLDVSYGHIMPALPSADFVSLYKWLAAALLILPQTVLLGMTFPLLAGGLIRRVRGEDGYNLGSLYFANSIGAAFGVLAATFAFLPMTGLPGAMMIGGALNLLVAAAAWILSGRGREAVAPKPPAERKPVERSGAILRVVLFATFLSSAASFAYEILFVRMIGLAVGSTLHAFELMIAAFVLGIALGARWVRKRANQTERPLLLVGYLQVWMGITALAGLALYSNAFTWVGFLMDALANSSGGYSLFNVGTGLISVAIMLPTAFFAGTTLPVFTVALLRNGYGESSIGRVYAWNTLGAIVGVMAAIHFLLPVFGIRLAMLTAAVVDIGIGVALFRFVAHKRADYGRLAAGLGVLFGAAIITVFVIQLDPLKLSSGVYRSGKPQLDERVDLLYYKDGKTSTVTLFQSPDGTRSIATNGKIDAGIRMGPGSTPTPDEPTMVLTGALPLAYKPDAETAAVIGLGSGITTHTLLAHPGFTRVDTIEIERAMVAAARGFGDRVSRAYDDPRSRLIIDDAKSYFSSQQKKYDLVISEPSNPWMSGVGNLFSKEFYSLIPDVLNDDGVFAQWLQLYEIDSRLVNAALGGMLPHFEHVHAYLANNTDLVLIASNRPLEVPDFDGLFKGAVGTELSGVGINDARQLHYRKVADRRLLAALTAVVPSPVNSDYYPILSLEAPRTRFERVNARWFVNLPILETGLLEWIGVRPPVVDPGWPGSTSYHLGETRAAAALAVRDWLNDPDAIQLSELRPETRNLALRLDAAAGILCGDRTDGDLMLAFETLAELGTLMLPHLGESLLQGVLIEPRWLGCDPASLHASTAFKLVEAMARRNPDAMVASGRAWLDNLDQLPSYLSPMDSMALTSLQFGLLGIDRPSEAYGVEDQYGAKIRSGGRFGATSRLLKAWIEQAGK